MEKRKKYMIFIILGMTILGGIMLVGNSYALFTTNQISKSAVTIKVGTVDPFLGVELYVKAGESETFVISLENKNDTVGKFLLYYKGILPNEVTFGYLEEEGMDIPLKEGVVLNQSGRNIYCLYVNNPTDEDVYIDLQSVGGLFNQMISLPTDGHYIEKTEKLGDIGGEPSDGRNKFITHIYQYDQNNVATKCITGEETTCVELSTAPNIYPSGTIIKYKVNDILEKYFHVIKDNGDTLTLQQRENTISRIAWYAGSNDNSKGPTTVLPVLEEATSTWSNVLDQTYILGTTTFRYNTYTGCSNYDFSSCTTNTYTLPVRTAKARLITLQETSALGCNFSDRSCPSWMNNYLFNSKRYGGTVSDGSDNQGYWTSSAKTSNSNTTDAWIVSYRGSISNYLNDGNTSKTDRGARAVVVIKK